MNPQEQAQELLRELRIKHVPVPVEEIATRLGAKITYEPFEGEADISGMLLREKDRTVIGVNSAHANVRQRFTIAHEIGHLRMHNGAFFVDKAVRFNRNNISSQAIDHREIEANGFAAELLMPAPLVTNAVKKRLAKKANLHAASLVNELAQEFQVSNQAMEFRLTNLGII
jgi:Zn-dependent peptidase ImmA (M78 family)